MSEGRATTRRPHVSTRSDRAGRPTLSVGSIHFPGHVAARFVKKLTKLDQSRNPRSARLLTSLRGEPSYALLVLCPSGSIRIEAHGRVVFVTESQRSAFLRAVWARYYADVLPWMERRKVRKHWWPTEAPMALASAPCSRCKGPNDRPDQRYCKACGAAYQKQRRARLYRPAAGEPECITNSRPPQTPPRVVELPVNTQEKPVPLRMESCSFATPTSVLLATGTDGLHTRASEDNCLNHQLKLMGRGQSPASPRKGFASPFTDGPQGCLDLEGGHSRPVPKKPKATNPPSRFVTHFHASVRARTGYRHPPIQWGKELNHAKKMLADLAQRARSAKKVGEREAMQMAEKRLREILAYAWDEDGWFAKLDEPSLSAFFRVFADTHERMLTEKRTVRERFYAGFACGPESIEASTIYNHFREVIGQRAAVAEVARIHGDDVARQFRRETER